MTNRVRIIQQLIHRGNFDNYVPCPLNNGKDKEWCSRFETSAECKNAWLDEECEEKDK